MKLASFRADDDSDALGVVEGDALIDLSETAVPTMGAFLEGLPATRREVDIAMATAPRRALSSVRLLSPVPRPPLLIDMGLTPRHLVQSARTLFRHALPPPLPWLLTAVVARGTRSVGPPFRYYKGLGHTVVGPGSETPWPRHSQYLDIEPELAIVIGAGPDPIAGYTILDDVSARDVQLPEMIGTGPTRSKDFAGSNVLGPWLVTADALPDPRALAVDAWVGDHHWQGRTDEYAATPQAVVADLRRSFPLPPGTVIGMGTVPDCTGLDHDTWLAPDSDVAIRIDGIGTLSHRIGPLPADLDPSRWGQRF